MQCQVLSSGSAGNCTLVRAGEELMLVDAGLPMRELYERLRLAKVPFKGIGHVLVTHAHLDHARSAGAIAKRHDAVVHCAEANMAHRSLSRAPQLQTLRIGSDVEIEGARGDLIGYRAVALPHDCSPTVAFRIEHKQRRLVVLTDMGAPRDDVAKALSGAHVLVLEFNYDPEMLATGPYPPALKRRISGGQGHLSNEQAMRMLADLIGPETHTLVLAHLSLKNNAPELAGAAAREALDSLGRSDVRLLIASQDEVGPTVEV